MFERNLIRQLRQWRSRERHKPLVLRGARQVGKTTIVTEFGKEFDTFIHLNLEREAGARVFSLTDDVHRTRCWRGGGDESLPDKEKGLCRLS